MENPANDAAKAFCVVLVAPSFALFGLVTLSIFLCVTQIEHTFGIGLEIRLGDRVLEKVATGGAHDSGKTVQPNEPCIADL